MSTFSRLCEGSMNYRKLHDDITEVVAKGLHYLENYERTSGLRMWCDPILSNLRCINERHT